MQFYSSFLVLKNPHCIRPTDTEEVLYQRCRCFKFLNSEIKFYFEMFCVSNFLDCTCQILFSELCSLNGIWSLIIIGLIIKCHLANKVVNFYTCQFCWHDHSNSYQTPTPECLIPIVLSTHFQHRNYCSF